MKYILDNINLILYILATSCFTTAGFLFTPIAGFTVLGVMLLVLAWTMTKGGET